MKLKIKTLKTKNKVLEALWEFFEENEFYEGRNVSYGGPSETIVGWFRMLRNLEPCFRRRKKSGGWSYVIEPAGTKKMPLEELVLWRAGLHLWLEQEMPCQPALIGFAIKDGSSFTWKLMLIPASVASRGSTSLRARKLEKSLSQALRHVKTVLSSNSELAEAPCEPSTRTVRPAASKLGSSS